MKLIRLALVVVFFFLSMCMANATYTWYWGYTHGVHTNDNDGLWTHLTAKMKARSMGAQFLSPSGHYDMLTAGERAKYLADFSGYYMGMLLVPGVEFGIKRADGGTSHLWTFFGAENFFGFTPARDLQGLIDQLSPYGAITSAAHPNWKDGLFDYSFDRSVTGFNMVEMFNGPYYYEDREYLLDLDRRGIKAAVESGVDSHSKDDPQDAARWLHKTYVCINGKLTKTNLYAAVLNGQTIATDNYTYPKVFNYLPGFTSRVVTRPYFNLQIGFSKTTGETRTVKVYRDGVLVWDSIRTFSKGIRSLTYIWRDNFTQPGTKRYRVEVDGCLFSSPITLRVTSPSPYPYNPVYDCFVGIDTGIGIIENPWADWGYGAIDDLSAENQSDVFFAPAHINFYIFFRNKIAFPIGWPEDALRWRMNIYNSSGELVTWSRRGIPYEPVWNACWGIDFFPIEVPGRYLFEVRDVNNQHILARKTFWVF